MSLPGADELFRTTGGMGLQASTPAERRRKANGEAQMPAPAGTKDSPAADGAGQGAAPGAGGPAPAAREEHSAAESEGAAHRRADPAPPQPRSAPPQEPVPAVQPQRGRGGGRGANRRPSGRERHDEKITVYVSAEELMDLEHARLVLRGEHGLAVDRGRIVREAVAVVLADLESRGDASILVRRLRGR
ncbi:hypothetical protein [Streptomyces nitrosporeus]|uniref:Cobyrinic acid a,c-diamide synthase n=1 Tax=Streptomyces nitrosporeus TaxID=28894 RepID=A0A5J6FGS1_9ACTN|nr:hypothetical protein [Streptomyces nitrosporeus]QEU75216.1 hypothetical protein CP967_27480 [Streptomyces nitrosporeus]GGZ19253.1 hypothetical protein GCM10010327_58020 [Streptomyces nitrosporeus]